MVFVSYIKRFLSGRQKAKIKFLLQNINRLLRGDGTVITECKYLVIREKGMHCFFGYYDISPFNDKDDVLYIRTTDNNTAEVMLFDSVSRNSQKIADTNVWNWQQGCRLRWMPGMENTIAYNDFNGFDYCCRIKNIQTGAIHTLEYALYDISPDGKIGLSLDFARLGVKRPGYGYTNVVYNEPNDLGSEGIDIYDLTQHKMMKRITYEQISESVCDHCFDLKNCYINHLSFSPDGSKFLFFFIDIQDNYHNAYLFVYDIHQETIIPLETSYKVSHYLWMNNQEILCTVYPTPTKCIYQLYNVNGIKHPVINDIQFDGHPVLLKDDLILTDSYPDKHGYQQLLIANIKTGNYRKILSVFSRPADSVEKRTDLHPRLNSGKNLICIDSNVSGIRNIFLIENGNCNSNYGL